ncbi:hypothetical protein [Chryseobacterium sp. MYb328]|uniref:hypothetical protein n=1 Tax=Chryseobacterium sp. MYb328 TaxID=2745231 RepID=UPI00309B9CB4
MEPIDYSRGRNSTNSKTAFKKVNETIPKMWERVLNEVDGKRSTIEIANELRVQIHVISGRFSELKAKHKIYQTSSKKIGSKHYAIYSKTIN